VFSDNIKISNLYLSLKPTHIAILIFFYIHKKVNSKEVPRDERQTFYVYVTDLIRMGLVSYEISKKDNRVKFYYLTDLGYEVAKRLYEVFIFLNNNNR